MASRKSLQNRVLPSDGLLASSDVLFHLLAERDETPGSYCESFVMAGRAGLVPADLAGRLQEAAGMRNVIVHLYDEMDYEIVRDSIEPALDDFGRLLTILEAHLPDHEA